MSTGNKSTKTKPIGRKQSKRRWLFYHPPSSLLALKDFGKSVITPTLTECSGCTNALVLQRREFSSHSHSHIFSFPSVRNILHSVLIPFLCVAELSRTATLYSCRLMPGLPLLPTRICRVKHTASHSPYIFEFFSMRSAFDMHVFGEGKQLT
ncbi:hypothetical protein CEXT_413101 [Caerostris extrusa]|uniref:Uncharacterized protein n=1 Tax=Caerostris extrusa TaxID=172846 RepID=A0AAV4SXD5_CAEEX|nr:hypothetical protein CEXT_413101 [Caerostris extrusa]